ncbi:unnamed protein product, partial [Thlaspi arvense]
MLLLPPRRRKSSGRRKTNRIPFVGEMPITRVKKDKPNKCSKCFQPGHNRLSCLKGE